MQITTSSRSHHKPPRRRVYSHNLALLSSHCAAKTRTYVNLCALRSTSSTIALTDVNRALVRDECRIFTLIGSEYAHT